MVGGLLALPLVAGGVGYLSQFGGGGSYVDADGKFTHVSVDSSFAHIADHPAFKGFGDYVVPWEAGFTATLTRPLAVKKLAPYLGAWDPQTMVDGVNFLIDEINAGRKLYYKLYDESEIAADPSREAAGLFFIPGDAGAPVAFVTAGGGFDSVASIQEAFPHAKALHALGYNVFVLKYRVGAQEGDAAPDKLDRIRRANGDMARAMSYIERHADEWHVSMDGYSVWGSSAGGRLATLWGSDSDLGAKAHGFDKPAAIVAAYAGITTSLEYSASFPPYFVTVAQDDNVISVSQLDAVVGELRSLGVQVQYEKVKSGGHGYGLGMGTAAEGWFDKAVAFWRSHGTDPAGK
ncbi:alpha/beta hydrolase [Nonomuraea sp. NPDC003201]